MSKDILHSSNKKLPSTALRRRYRIELRGHLSEIWTAFLEPVTVSITDRTTSIEVLVDQAALRGILNRLWDLNLDVLSVAEITGENDQNGGY